MAAVLEKVTHPLGGDLFFEDGGIAKHVYKITGDGNATTLQASWGRLGSFISHDADESLSPVIDTANRRVTLSVPASLGAGETVFVSVRGKGGV